MLKNPFRINEMLPAMTSDHDIEWLAAQLMPRVRGYISAYDGRAPLRAITYAHYRVDDDGNVIITGERDEAFAGECVYAVYQNGSDPTSTYEHTLKVCQDEATAERLAKELRTLVYGRERLAGRMRGCNDD